MKYTALLIGLVTFLLLGTSCENDGFYYQDEPRVRLEGPDIWTNGADSLEFSFVTYPADTLEKAMDVAACVIGTTLDRARTVNLAVDETKTTAPADLYTVPATVVIPAGANEAVFQVYLKRSEALEDTTVQLYLKVVPSEDFAVGTNEENHLLLKWNDKIAKPSNWEQLEEFFGTYSNVKYRFMINNAGGLTEFNADTMSWAELSNYKIRFVNALNEYNAAHPGEPLRDENGALVTFN